MVRVSHDHERNIVTIEFEGNIDAAEAKRFFADLGNVRPHLRTGFTLLTDFTLVDTMALSVKGEIEKAMDLFNAQGVTEIVRVIPDSNMDFGFNLMSHAHYSRRVNVHTFRSRQEAQDFVNTRHTSHIEGASRILPSGSPAPEFTAYIAPDRTLSLSELRGRPVILAFYPADWSPVCGDQMALYNEILPEFRKYGAELLGISVDGVWCHAAFARDRKLHFPLLADFEPKGHIARKYGAYRDGDGFSERALFVIDTNGTICWSYYSPIEVNPGADGILHALDTLSK